MSGQNTKSAPTTPTPTIRSQCPSHPWPKELGTNPSASNPVLRFQPQKCNHVSRNDSHWCANHMCFFSRVRVVLQLHDIWTVLILRLAKQGARGRAYVPLTAQRVRWKNVRYLDRILAIYDHLVFKRVVWPSSFIQNPNATCRVCLLETYPTTLAGSGH